MPSKPSIDDLLARIREGDKASLDHFWAIVEPEMKSLARGLMQHERGDHTLQPTALVSEAWLRIPGTHRELTWKNRRTFFAGVAKAMRRVLVDYARKHRAGKRGDGQKPVPLIDVCDSPAHEFLSHVEMLDFDEALETLREIDERRADIIEHRLLLGFNVVETAKIFGVSTNTVINDYRVARLWLRERLRDTQEEESHGE